MTRVSLEEGRYARQELITWWDQSLLTKASVLVVGAGALGNEIVKNLALLGLGSIDVIDMDKVERSNLSRGVFFREDSLGEYKSVVVARGAESLNPDIKVQGLVRSVARIGLGRLLEYDLIIAGLDNREARVWINQACRKLSMTWVDGAIEGLRGVARVFPPTGACYECTLGEVDRAILAHRRSCALLTEEEIDQGKTPTTASTSSIVAGFEVQEAVKLLQGRPDLLSLANRAIMFLGETLDTYLVDYSEDPFCLAHDEYVDIRHFSATESTTLEALFDEASQSLEGELVASFEDDVVVGARCIKCKETKVLARALGSLYRASVECPSCGEVMSLDARNSFQRSDPLATKALARLGLPEDDVVTIRGGSEKRIHFIVNGLGGWRADPDL